MRQLTAQERGQFSYYLRLKVEEKIFLFLVIFHSFIEEGGIVGDEEGVVELTLGEDSLKVNLVKMVTPLDQLIDGLYDDLSGN